MDMRDEKPEWSKPCLTLELDISDDTELVQNKNAICGDLCGTGGIHTSGS